MVRDLVVLRGGARKTPRLIKNGVRERCDLRPTPVGDRRVVDTQQPTLLSLLKPFESAGIAILLILLPPRVGRQHGLAYITDHANVDSGLQQIMDDLPVVPTQILNLVDQNFVVEML
ncbi:hypothetical protein D3C80_1649420 [compost metagenome]